MYRGLCHGGNLNSVGNFDGWDLMGLGLTVIFWVGLLAALTVLVVYAVRRARVPATAGLRAAGQPTAGGHDNPRETLQAQYARGEITREQYERRKQDMDLKGETK